MEFEKICPHCGKKTTAKFSLLGMVRKSYICIFCQKKFILDISWIAVGGYFVLVGIVTTVLYKLTGASNLTLLLALLVITFTISFYYQYFAQSDCLPEE